MIRILEVDLDSVGLILVILAIALSPAILLTIIGFGIKNKKPKTAKVLFIIATVYTLIGLGICGTILTL